MKKNVLFLILTIIILTTTACNNKISNETNENKSTSSTTTKEIKGLAKLAYNKVYMAIYEEDYFNKGMYIIFYEDGRLKYNQNNCEGYELIDGTYRIEEDRVIVKIPYALTDEKEWAMKVVDDTLMFDESYKKIEYFCGFSRNFQLSE